MVVLTELINSFFKVEGSITVVNLLQCGNHQLLREINNSINSNDKNEMVHNTGPHTNREHIQH